MGSYYDGISVHPVHLRPLMAIPVEFKNCFGHCATKCHIYD